MKSLENLLSEMGKAISYMAKASLHGHSGTVVEVEHLGPYDPETNEYLLYQRDDYGNLPSKITFRNPLGKLIERISRPVLEKNYNSQTEIVDHSWVYPDYKIGDEYP